MFTSSSESLEEPRRDVDDQNIQLPQLVLEYLESKSFFSAEQALRAQLASDAHQSLSEDMAGMQSKNLCTSRLEVMLGRESKTSNQVFHLPAVIEHFAMRPASACDATHENQFGDLQTRASRVQAATHENQFGDLQTRVSPVQAQASRTNSVARREIVIESPCTTSEEAELRVHHGAHSSRTNVIFNDHPSRSTARNRLTQISLPLIYDPNRSAHAARAPHALPSATHTRLARVPLVVTPAWLLASRVLPQQWT